MKNRVKDNIIFREISEERLLIQRVRSDVLWLTHSFFSGEKYMLIDPPLLHEQVKNKKFEIYLPLYNNSYSLNFSNALYMGAYASLFGNVYSISTCFRDEQESINHLLEFKMLEVEIVNCTFDILLKLIEKYIKFILINLANKYKYNEIGYRIKVLLSSFNPIRVSYDNFISNINQHQDNKVDYGVDLSSIDYIVSQLMKNPTFIVDYPFPLATWTAKPKTAKIANAFNLILPDSFGELAEGCERNNNIDMLSYKFKCAGIENLQWYLDAISKSHINRSGFGLGIDRLVRWIVGVDDVRKTVLFPRIGYGEGEK